MEQLVKRTIKPVWEKTKDGSSPHLVFHSPREGGVDEGSDTLCCVRFEDDALISGFLDEEEVSNDVFNCFIVATFGVVSETSTLVDVVDELWLGTVDQII